MLTVFLYLLSASQIYFKISFIEFGVVVFASQSTEPSIILSCFSEHSWAPVISGGSMKGTVMGNVIASSGVGGFLRSFLLFESVT